MSNELEEQRLPRNAAASGRVPARSLARSDPGPWGLSTQVALLWILLALLTIGLSLTIDGSTLRTSLLPGKLRQANVAWELLLLALPVLLVGAPFAFLGQLVRRHFADSTITRRVAHLLLSLLFCVPMGLYISSWVGFSSNRLFLDAEGYRFIAANPVQFFQHAAHIDPLAFVASPLLVLAISMGWIWWTPRFVARLRPKTHVIVSSAMLAIIAVLAVVVIAVEPTPGMLLRPVLDPEVGTIYTFGDLYRSCRDDRSGPVTHALADFRAPAAGSVKNLEVDENIEIHRAPILPMDDFVRQVDANQVKRWNVIVVIVESLRSDQLAILGGPRVVMPHLETIAAEARRYPDHYTQASHSNYADICPLSSHYPLRSPETHVYPENPTYPRVLIYDILKALGWHTAIISSQNETWGGMINYLSTGSVDHFFHSETFEGETYIPRNDKGFEEFIKGSKRSGKIDDRLTVDEAIRWTGHLPDDEPFFIYLNLQNSHLPYETPADFPRPFGPDEISFQIKFGGYPKGKTRIVKDRYADSLAYSDFQLDRLISALKERGEWERTLLVVTGDTGQAFYEHGIVAHAGAIFNEVMQVPLVIRAPGLSPAEDRRPAQHIDVAPSILALLGLPPHPSFQGESLFAPNPNPNRSRYLLSQTPNAHQYGIVRDGFKLVYGARVDKEILFDLNRDPGETVNVIEKHPELAKELRLRLDTWRKNQVEYYRDPALHSRTYPPVLED